MQKLSLNQELVLIIGTTLLAFLFVSLFPGCANKPVYPQNVLADQMIYPHPDYPGLVNRACVQYEKDECKKWNVEVQDTSKPEVRANLQRMKFVCDVAGKLYHPCMQKNSLCRTTYGPRPVLGIIGARPRITQYLSLEKGPERDYLIAAKTVCHRYGAYGDESEW